MILGGGRGRRLRRGLLISRDYVNRFARAREVQLLAGFAFDRRRIDVELPVLPCQAIIFLLHALHFLLQIAILSAFFLVHNHSVSAKDDVKADRTGQQGHSNRGHTSAEAVDKFENGTEKRHLLFTIRSSAC